MVAIITSVIKEKRGDTILKLFALSVMVAIILFLNGCGYKAPPYYEKPAAAKESSVAL
ncbi:MAG TPA: hypothetical protein VJA83_05100 [Sulfuricurvum sp.]|nr:hypothetical protein [Sulfuricurvum sp.]